MEAFKFFNNPERLARNAGLELVQDEKFKPYDPEATVEFDPIEKPLSNAEAEIAKTIDPDQLALEGLDRAIDTWGMGC